MISAKVAALQSAAGSSHQCGALDQTAARDRTPEKESTGTTL